MIPWKKTLLAVALLASSHQAATYTTVLQNGTEGYTGCQDAHVDKARGVPLYQSATLTTSWN